MCFVVLNVSIDVCIDQRSGGEVFLLELAMAAAQKVFETSNSAKFLNSSFNVHSSNMCRSTEASAHVYASGCG